MRRLPTPALVTAAAVALIALAAVAGAALRAPAPPPTREETASFYSPAIRGTISLTVLLPAAYDGQRRFPVIYFLHGLPASSQTYRNVGFLRAALAAETRPAILVAPQAARDNDTDPEYLDWGPGRNGETAVSRELPAYIDSHFQTIRNRRGRAIVGLSAGGYGAVLLAIHHLEAFSVVESWSGYFHPTDPSGRSTLNLGSPERNRRANVHAVVGSLRREFRESPTFFAFYVGRGDTRFRADNLQLHRELVSARVPHVFKVYPGAHAERVWRAHARAWLGLALLHLQQPLVDPPVAGGADLSGFTRIATGGSGGAIWRGRIPNSVVAWDRRPSAIYLPPAFDPTRQYPVAFLLHGFPGSPSGFYDSLRLADVADALISTGKVKPFVAVMPVAGRTALPRSADEWAGRWETYFIRDVVPWSATHLPVSSVASDRVIAGLSSGGFGAPDIALRHPGLFGVVEAWSGYFHPVADGPLAHASQAELAAHDPTLLVRKDAALLRRDHVRFYLSTGFNHAGIRRSWTLDFARLLRSLRLPVRVWASRTPDHGRYLLLQLPAALEFAFPR
jgi:enterochelin esterase-like enzyme